MLTVVNVQCEDEKNQIFTKAKVYWALNLAPKGELVK
jgi:hypothetical protein